MFLDEIELSLGHRRDTARGQQQQPKHTLMELSRRSLTHGFAQQPQPPPPPATHAPGLGTSNFDAGSIESNDTYASCNTHPFNSLLDLTIIEAAPSTSAAVQTSVSYSQDTLSSSVAFQDAQNGFGFVNPFDYGGDRRSPVGDTSSCQTALLLAHEQPADTLVSECVEYSIAHEQQRQQQHKHVSVIAPDDTAARVESSKKRFVRLFVRSFARSLVRALCSRHFARHAVLIERLNLSV